jgi:hypothetical protein
VSSLILAVAACYYPPPESATAPIPVDGEAHVTNERWFLQYAVATNVHATPEQVWAVLTDASGYTGWNTTVTSLDGTIAKDQQIHLKVKVAGDRQFDLTVSDLQPPTRMVWSDGSDNFRGVRTFTLTGKPDGTTDFDMREDFTGRMLPMIAGSLPDFTGDFETFAADLKAEVEKRNPPAPPPAPETTADGTAPPAP